MKTLNLITPDAYLNKINSSWLLLLALAAIACFTVGYLVGKDKANEN